MSSRSNGRTGLARAALAAGGLTACIVLALTVVAAAATPGLTLTATDATVGGAIHASAELAEVTPTAGEEITFEVFGPGDPTCSGSPLTPAPAPAPVNGPSTYESGDFTTTAAGTYHWRAKYPGDGENEAAESDCTATSTVAKASPGLSGSATASAAAGQTITDEATLSGAFEAGGHILFRAYGPGDATCAEAPAYEEQVTVSGNGVYEPAGFAATAGSYRWTASYSGDANNAEASTACDAAGQTSTVAKASPGLSGSATASATAGQTIIDEATLSGAFEAGGQIVFRAYGPGDATCAETPAYEEQVTVSGNGVYEPAGFAATAGVYRWVAVYQGDANNEAASTACGEAGRVSTVSKATPALAASATSSPASEPITDEATLSGAFEATGHILFRAYGPADTECLETPVYEAEVTVSGNGAYKPVGFSTAVGVYQWEAVYSGDANNEAASTACGEAGQSSTVSKATPALSGSASDAVINTAIHDEVTFTSAFSPSGEVIFKIFAPGDTRCVTVSETTTAPIVAGHARSPDFVAQQAGEYRWMASYLGDTEDEVASTTCGAAGQTRRSGCPT